MPIKRFQANRCRPAPWFIAIAVCVPPGCGQPLKTGSRPPDPAALGKQIFHDESLSRDRKTSCASCHRPSLAFTDGRPTSIGANGKVGTRNAPSLLDLSSTTKFFWDGRETILGEVVLQAFTNPVEMGLDSHQTLLERIDLAASGGAGTRISMKMVSRALVAYLNSLPRQPNRYDLYRRNPALHPLSETERAGLALFTGKAECSQCHPLPATGNGYFTDGRFHHAGVGFEQVAGRVTPLLSRLEHLQAEGKPIGAAILADKPLAELGRFAVSRSPAELGAFRTPSLRNVALTAPYMHDGSIATLPEALDHEIYYRSLARGRPITLTVAERRALLAFLDTLSATPAEDGKAGHPQ